MTRLEEITARFAAASKGPYRWRANTSARDAHLVSQVSPRNVVLGFERWGVQSARPVFLSARGILEPPKMIPSAPHNAWDIVAFDHPDARFLEHSWEDIGYLVSELATLRAFLDEEVMPRYTEMFQLAGLGQPGDSTIIQRAAALLFADDDETRAARMAEVRRDFGTQEEAEDGQLAHRENDRNV